MYYFVAAVAALRVHRQNIQRERPKTKRPRDKMSQDKTSQGQNVPRQNVPGIKHPTLITKFSKINFVLENWPHMFGHGPHPCTQFMIGVFLFWEG